MNADFGNASYRPPPLPRSLYADPKPLSSAEFVHRRDQPFYENPVTFGPTVVLPATAPIPVIDSNNRINEPRILPTSLVASQIITLDSRDRDLNEYPSANQFRMILPTALRNVQCVELMQALIPVLRVPSAAGTTGGPYEPYLVLRVDELPVCKTAQPFNAQSANYNPVSEDAFADFIIAPELDRAQPYFHWSRTSGKKAIKIFPSLLDKLATLTISLWSRTSASKAVPYPLPPESLAGGTSPLNNIFLQFEVVCS